MILRTRDEAVKQKWESITRSCGYIREGVACFYCFPGGEMIYPHEYSKDVKAHAKSVLRTKKEGQTEYRLNELGYHILFHCYFCGEECDRLVELLDDEYPVEACKGCLEKAIRMIDGGEE